MRRITLILSGLASCLLLIAGYLPQKLAINPTASAPKGLYWIDRSATPKTGDMVMVSVPETYRDFVVERAYLALDIPLIKQIVALEGDAICSIDRRIFINDHYRATALKTDSKGRKMPSWSGCITLLPDQFFALMPALDSLDSRYFGPLNTHQIRGVLSPIWTESALESREEKR